MPGKLLFRALLSCALAAPLGAGVLPGAASADAPAVGRGLEWTPCAAESVGQCTTIPVPVDWDNPRAGTFDLHVGRLPATEPENRIGTLFLVRLRGITEVVVNRAFPGTDTLVKRFDIVTWDLRGTGRSNPVLCDAALIAQGANRPYPTTDAEYQDLLAYNAALGADCRSHTGPVFDHVDADSVARDMDAIRGALGERTISSFTAGYTTIISQRYADLFPHRVRTMVLDTNRDHSITSTGRFLEDVSAAQEEAFEQFVAWCDRTASCALHGSDVVAIWEDLYAKAQRGELVNPATGRPVTDEALHTFMTSTLYDARWFVDLANQLAALRVPAAPTAVAAAPPATAEVAAAAEVPLAANLIQAANCADWRWPARSAEQLRTYLARMSRVAPHTKLVFNGWWDDVTQCVGWPARTNYPQDRQSVTGAPPILVVAGRYDPATPVRWSRAVADQIDKSVVLHYDGVGFGQYFLSGCVREHVQQYLISGRPPAPDTHCPALFPGGPAAATAGPLSGTGAPTLDAPLLQPAG